MYEGLNKMFWGIFFATFHLNLGPVKILPAFVGFMLISSGINTIYVEHKDEEWKKALDLSRIAIVVSLLGGVIDFFLFGAYNYSIIILLWPILLMVVELLMFYNFFIGLVKYFHSMGKIEVSESLIGSSRFYLIIFIINTAFLSFTQLFNWEGINTLLAIIFIILRISLMVIISGLKKQIIPFNPDKKQGL